MDGICSELSEYTNTSQCVASNGGLEVILFTSLISTLMDANLRLGNPDDYPPDASSHLLDEYDFIVIGAGSAGSVVASRLSEVGDWKVLLLEAGGDPTPTSDVPALYLSLQKTELDWQYKTFRDNRTCLGFENQQCNWPRGKALGGSSTINAMQYVRGNERDYDIWEKLGNRGWSYHDVLPYFKKSEGNRNKDFVEEDPDGIQYHSDKGPLSVELYNKVILGEYLKEGVKEIGYDLIEDINGPNQLGFANIQGTLRNATRCNAAKAFLGPAKNRKNLHVSKHSHAMKININSESKRAYSVKFRTGEGKILDVRFRKEVIVSAGSVNTPQILMLSGIGPKNHLRDIGIGVIQDLKVGENLQDHFMFFGAVFSVNNDTEFGIPPAAYDDAIFEYLTKRKGYYSTSPVTFTGFIKSKYSVDGRPDLQFHTLLLKHKDYNALQIFVDALGFTNDSFDFFKQIIEKKDLVIIAPTLLHPKSIGKILLKSANPFDKPEIHPRYLSKRIDVKIMLEGIDFTTKLMTTKAMKSKGSTREKLFVRGCHRLRFDSQSYWRCMLRHVGSTVYHPTGTCKMGPRTDPNAVVDPELKVHGIRGIRVVDASIMPEIVRGNTNAPAIMIGEKGADYIKKDWINY